MANEKSVLIGFFGNYPLIRILDFLIENRGFDYSKTEISKGAGVSWGSLYKLWNKIERLDMVTCTRSFGKTRLYKLNEKNPFMKRILRLELDLIKHYAEADTRAYSGEHKTPAAVPTV
ncbi:MAG: hypothetical protein U9Q22_01820 [Candidatus Altiarchaeota archaeon]|nr:hypothetical protein [Candidatus Altiarchaeota archaeon]